MIEHDDIVSMSTALCNHLNESLMAKVEKLERSCWRDWCSFKGKGKVFAWARHNKKGDRIEVFFLGDANQAAEYSLTFTQLSAKRNTSARMKGFGGSFEVRDEVALRNVVKFLVVVSHPLSVR
jgi:hypothetical protein